MTRQELEALFLTNLPTTEKILGAIGRRHRLSPDAVDEYSAWVKLRLVENDYAILAKFRGESSLATYLTVVIAMLYREYRVQEWGRWRPSAAAKRRGPLGVRLETLVNRDGMSIVEAGRFLRTSGETTLSDRELAAIVSELPRRAPLRPVDATDPPDDTEASDRADQRVDASEADVASEQAKRALVAALDALPQDDRLIVRLHYLESMSVADIARGLAIPQKPLYRRLDRLLANLRVSLERAGISRERVRELAAGPP